MSEQSNRFRYMLAGLAAGVGATVVFNLATQPPGPATVAPGEVYYSDFMAKAKGGAVDAVVIEGSEVTGMFKGGPRFKTRIPDGDSTAVKELRESGVSIISRPPSQQSGILSTLLGWAPMLLLIGVWVYFMRQMQAGKGGGATGFGKSKAKMLTQMKGRVTFDDVAGIDEAKEDLEEIVEFLRDPSKFQRLGGKIPKGGLLVGPPGTGKTLVARAVAGEANVPFFTVSGSDFVEMFVGVGASRVRDMFEQAKKSAPCIIFIDEIDALGRARNSGPGGGNDEREQTLNQLLVEMDGFEKTDSVIILAATNRPDILDSALRRPGRFDRQIMVGLADINGREKILKVHMRNVPIAPDVDVRVIARGTPGMSGADLANLVNEAALMAARRGKRLVGMAEFEDAKDRVLMGPERKSHVMNEEEKRLVAYHEAGHAVLAINQKHSHPIHKATIIPRGNAGGFVLRLPEKDGGSMYLRQLKADLVVAAGGRVAEELVFGKENISIGAQGDIRMATNIAKAMVTEYGASDSIGFVSHSAGSREILGQSIPGQSGASEATAQLIDQETKRLIDEGYSEAARILTEYKDQLENVAQALLEYETLTGEEVKAAAARGKDAVGVLRAEKMAALPRSKSLPGLFTIGPFGSNHPPGPAPDNL